MSSWLKKGSKAWKGRKIEGKAELKVKAKKQTSHAGGWEPQDTKSKESRETKKSIRYEWAGLRWLTDTHNESLGIGIWNGSRETSRVRRGVWYVLVM